MYQQIQAQSTSRPIESEQHDLNPRTKTVEVSLVRKLYGSSVVAKLVTYLVITVAFFLALVESREKFNLLYSRGPHPFTDISCLAAKLIVGGPTIISDVTDLWPDSLAYLPNKPRAGHLMIVIGNAVNTLTFRRIDAIVTHNELMKASLSRRYQKRVDVIYGVIGLDAFERVDRVVARTELKNSFGLAFDENKFWVLHAGLLGPFQNPEAIVSLAFQLRGVESVGFLIVGQGPDVPVVARRVESLGLKNVLFVGTQPATAMPYIYSIADLGLVSYPDIGFLAIGLPKKFIEYSASSLPILCLTSPCKASALCEEFNAGSHFFPSDIKGAADFVLALKNDGRLWSLMAHNSRTLAETMFSEERAAEILRHLLGR